MPPEPQTITDAITQTYQKMMKEKSLTPDKIKELRIKDVQARARADHPKLKFSESESIFYDVRNKLTPKIQAAPTKSTAPSTATVVKPPDTVPSQFSAQQLAAKRPNFTEQDCVDLYGAPRDVICLAFNAQRQPQDYISEARIKSQGHHLYNLCIKYGITDLPMAEIIFAMFSVADYGPLVRDVVLGREKKEPKREPEPTTLETGAPLKSATQPEVEAHTVPADQMAKLLKGGAVMQT